jgi:penicillin-binding protein 2
LASRPVFRGPNKFLPSDPRVAEPYRLTPQLALRIGILGFVALGLFTILFLRLWSLQILSGDRYLNVAQNNQLRTIRVEAPRGSILDRTGRVIVTNVPGTSVRLWPAQLPKESRYATVKKLADLLTVPLPRLLKEIDARKGDPLTPVTVKTSVHEDQVAYLYEHSREFPGIEIASTYLRKYPWQAMGAQWLGHVGEISEEQLKTREEKGYRGGDRIGQAGVEAAYDEYLRGSAGTAKLRVDALGRPRDRLRGAIEPTRGDAVRLTIDAGLQRAAEQALRYGIQVARDSKCVGCWAANGGAIVALDPKDGAILAMASNPTYKPSTFVGRVDAKKLQKLNDPDGNAPLLNRAVAGLYPPGSTFKPVTALAAMQEHLITPYSFLPCTPDYKKDQQTFKNWNPFTNQAMTLPVALAQSCDTYFYELGYRFYALPKERGSPLQKWARLFGFGEQSGLDIGGEESGLLPDPAWRRRTYTKESDPCCWEIDRLWKSGDSIQLAIGQKDLLVTPLQMARFYALLANGGRLVKPYLVMDVEQPGNDRAPTVVKRTFLPPAAQPVGIDPAALNVVREGLYRATHDTDGTSVGVFGDFPVPIAGKTGTAEKAVSLPGYTGMFDQAWWCGYGPSDDPSLVVCALIENGGHGGVSAAPAALKVFQHFFKVPETQVRFVPSD